MEEHLEVNAHCIDINYRSNCCLKPTQEFGSYIMSSTSS